MELTLTETILKVLKAQFNKTCADLGITNYEIFDEQEFANKEVEEDKIYIILTAKPGTDFYKSSVVPVDINIVSEQNTLQVAKQLADFFGTEWTLEDTLIGITNAYIQQAYTTPTVQTNFEEIDNGYRSIVSFTGTFVIAYNILSINSILIDGVEVKVAGLSMTFTNSPDPQPFYTSKTRVKTINKFGSFSINITVETIDSAFMNKVNSITLGDATINNNFLFAFSLGTQSLLDGNLKLIDWHFTQNKGEIPQATMTFSR